MLTTIVIGNTGYAPGAVAYSGFAGSGGTKTWYQGGIFEPRLTISDTNYSTFEFNVITCGPALPFPPGLQVQVVTSNADGSSPVIRFTGDLQKPEGKYSSMGLAWGYLATDLKRRGDYVTLLSQAGTSPAGFNLALNDPLYLYSQSGLTVGQIVTDILQATPNATALSGLGIGNYTIAGSVYTLPSTTATDLAALTYVPASPVNLAGECILSVLEAFIQTWMAQNVLYVQPDGTIRVVPIFGRTAHTLTQPSGTSSTGDPVFDLVQSVSIENCYGAVQITGQDIRGAVLSVADGTLVHSAAQPSSPPWTLFDFNSPNVNNNSQDDGTASSVTSVSCVVHSNHSTVNWPANYWNSFGGFVVLTYLAGTGIAITETRQITACTAMSAGGTATITWSSSDPLDSTSYTAYRLYALNTTRSLWDRKFLIREPASGNTGLNTFIGANLFPYFPYGFAWGNEGKGAATVSYIQYPAASVEWSSTGAWPYITESVNVTVNPQEGSIILSQPAVMKSADMAGMTSNLYYGYPANSFLGLWSDITVAVPYNRGDVAVRYPASGFQGTAYTTYGRALVKTVPLPNFIFKGDSAALSQLAQQILLTIQDAVTAGSIRMHYDAWTPTFDPLTFPYALNIATPGGASAIDGLNLPVRSVTMEWPDGDSPDIHLLTFNFSNQHRQFQGDAMYIHPMFAPTGWGTQGGSEFVGGSTGGAFQWDLPASSEGLSYDVGTGGDLAAAGGSGHEARLEKQRQADQAARDRRAKPKRDAGMTGPAENPEVSKIQVDPPRLSLRERRGSGDDDTTSGGGG